MSGFPFNHRSVAEIDANAASSKGVFAPTAGRGLNFRTRKSASARSAWTPDQDARFFDAVADGATIDDASRRVGKTRNAGQSRFAQVRRGFGWQGA